MFHRGKLAQLRSLPKTGIQSEQPIGQHGHEKLEILGNPIDRGALGQHHGPGDDYRGQGGLESLGAAGS